MNTAVYIHGRGGTPEEAAHYRPLFPSCEVTGIGYRADTPWEAGAEIREAILPLKNSSGKVILIANSIGAFFAMHAGIGEAIARAYFISPVTDMERLIADMMADAGIREKELRERRTVSTADGEILSWEYLSYVRGHPIRWDVPTEILCGGGDPLAFPSAAAFARKYGAGLTVMENGEHWFHTEEQMRFLDNWIREKEAAVTREQRITVYEQALDRVNAAARQTEEALAAYDDAQKDLLALERYYTGREWKDDFAADEAGLLPPGLKRGVLSEDGIDRALERFRDLRERILPDAPPE